MNPSHRLDKSLTQNKASIQWTPGGKFFKKFK